MKPLTKFSRNSMKVLEIGKLLAPAGKGCGLSKWQTLMARRLNSETKAMLEQGRIGHWLGSKQATTNIVAIVAVGLLSLIAISLVAALVKGIEIFTAAGLPLLSALTLILGYLFGRSVR